VTIGLDFDNTIVSYDALFFELARERELIPAELPASKTAIRDHLRLRGREPAWTTLQGLAYGDAIWRASIFPGALDFVNACRAAGIPVAIVSHKTRRPYLGADTDLHATARGWLQQHGLGEVETFFELTTQAKLSRIRGLACTSFVDDLPEFLNLPDFPSWTRKILFDPSGLYAPCADTRAVRSWSEIRAMVLCQSIAVC
jgi:hypothetical protein